MDLHCLVVANHRLTLERIDQCEDEDVSELEHETDLDGEALSSAIRQRRSACNELREAARHLALVGVVTRMGCRVEQLTNLRGLGRLTGPGLLLRAWVA